MTAVIYFYNGSLLLFGVYLSVKTRKTFSAFKESQLIGFSIYTITIVAVSFLPIIYIPLSIQIQFGLRSFAVM